MSSTENESDSRERNRKVICKYGISCYNLNCKFDHPSNWNEDLARANKGKLPCRYGNTCRDKDSCLYLHK